MIPFESIQEFWNSFFFAEENVSVWVIFRIIFGTICFFNTLLMFYDRYKWYDIETGFGIRTRRDPHTIPPWPRLCIWDYFPEHKRSHDIICGLWLLSCVGIIIGFLFPISCFVFFVISTSAVHRNIMCNHSGDSYVRLITFIMLAGALLNPDGTVFSVDYYIANGTANNFGLDLSWSPWPARMVMITWVSCYSIASIHKLKGPFWRNGTAAYYPTYVTGFARWRVPKFMLIPLFVKIGTWGTMLVEASAPLALIPECRKYAVGLNVLMTISFEYFLNIQLFGLIMISSAVIWVDPQAAHDMMINIYEWIS